MKVWEVLLEEDRERRHVRRHVRGRIKVAIDSITLSIGQFFLGLSISQVAPNAWRIFIGAEIL